MASVMKKVLTGLGGLIAAALVLLIALFIIGVLVDGEPSSSVPSEKELIRLTKGTMTDFARAVRGGDFRSLREKASKAMKDEYAIEKFTQTFSPFRKLQVDWSEIERHQPILEGEGEMEGDRFLVVTGYYPTDPQKVSFKLKYLLEKKEWKLAWIHVQTAPSSDKGAANQNLPSRAMQIQMVRQTLSLFDECISRNDFYNLHESASKSWKALYSKESVQEKFSVLSSMQVDFSVPDPFQPEFEKAPYLDDSGLLHLKGFYTNSSGKRYFDLTYVLEGSQWRMAAIQVNWEHTPPGQDQMVQLVKETMNAFALAVVSKDFTEFYNSRLARPLQEKYSKAAFQGLFQTFMDQNIDLRVLQQYGPKFDQKPGLDQKGLLVLKGYFPTRPSRAIFDMKFIKQGEAWKLIALYVNVKPVKE
jgi:hypothetical protein